MITIFLLTDTDIMCPSLAQQKPAGFVNEFGCAEVVETALQIVSGICVYCHSVYK